MCHFNDQKRPDLPEVKAMLKAFLRGKMEDKSVSLYDMIQYRLAEFEAKDIAAIPIGSDGKFRVHRCTIVGEKDLAELGKTQNLSEEVNTNVVR